MPTMSKEMLVSLTAAAANVATAAAMVFMVRKMMQITNNGDEKLAALLGEDIEFTKQVTPIPELEKYGAAMTSEGVVLPARSASNDNVLIKDNPESVIAMREVFKRLCTSARELVSVGDVEKVHHLLGEPIGEKEKQDMMTFFGAQDEVTSCVTFDDFMRWWAKIHDSEGQPDSNYFSRERYRARFKVLQSRLQDPNIAKIETITEGDIKSRRYRVHFQVDAVRISPWHDIPLQNADSSYNFICEVPKWTRKKFEIATGEAMNPIKQDVKNGVLREYKWGDMLFNYGCFPQTWEDPKEISEETGCPGDNDPIDVVEIGIRQRPVGSVTRVKVLGVVAMIDSDETDWKVIALAMDDDEASRIQDIHDLDAHMPGLTASLIHWLQFYKTADGKAENKFGCGGKAQPAAYAKKIIQSTHESWKNLLQEASAKGTMKRSASGTLQSTELTVES